MSLTAEEFDYVKALVFKGAAIVLESDKSYLVESRLAPLASRMGLPTTSDLVAHLRSGPFNGLHKKVIEAMTTNETFFFRDVQPFEALRRVVLPELDAKRTRPLFIWCAACSTGQEPYSIAMLVREHFPALADKGLRILASDISDEVLQRARAGTFSQIEIGRGLSVPYLFKYFDRHGSDWRVNSAIRALVEFRQINLVEPWPALPLIDIIFLRNVLIYFDVATKRTILANVRRVMHASGYIFLGGSETTFRLDDCFERVDFDRANCYRLKPTKSKMEIDLGASI